MSDLLVSIQMRFPTLDREAVAEHLGPVMIAAVAAGGSLTSVSIQPYDDEDGEAP